ncbi:hypothetical protein F8388_001035 [Cannabis sativa]|uniref:SWIM-type domain-containing protein n=1 Tax=Cannabis sativa TaxID=3483 RepID=A0A7J6DZ31_CANSA|nr:hypothetical protein F8388_001035 [Cannabis sativa]
MSIVIWIIIEEVLTLFFVPGLFNKWLPRNWILGSYFILNGQTVLKLLCYITEGIATGEAREEDVALSYVEFWESFVTCTRSEPNFQNAFRSDFNKHTNKHINPSCELGGLNNPSNQPWNILLPMICYLVLIFKILLDLNTVPHIPAGKTDFLQTYYKQAAAIFTRNIYYKVKEQIEEEQPYSISHREDQGDTYLFSLARFQYGTIRHRVLYNKEKNELNCSCLLFESDGIPCKHIWCVMKSLDIRVIPESLILTRWRKDVKTSSSTQVGEHSSEHQKMTQLSRFGALNAYSNSMNFFASHSEATFQMAKMELEKLNTIFRASYEEGHNSQNSQPTTTYRDNPNIIQDPVRVRTKGMASTNSRKGTNDGVQGGRQCTLCGGRDHNKRTCMRRTGV